MPRPSSPLTLAATALAAVFLTGCGAANPRMLSENQSQRLVNTVDSIEQAVASGDCVDALRRVARLQVEVRALPPTVAERLRERLAQGANHLQSRVPQDCRGEEEATPTPTEAPTETPVPTPTPTPTPAPTETETPTPAPEEPQETEDGDEGGEGEEEAGREGAAVDGGKGNEQDKDKDKDNDKGKGRE